MLRLAAILFASVFALLLAAEEWAFIPDPAGYAGDIPVTREQLLWYLDKSPEQQEPDPDRTKALLTAEADQWRSAWRLLHLLTADGIDIGVEATRARLADPAFAAVLEEVSPGGEATAEALDRLAGDPDVRLRFGVLAWARIHCADAPECGDAAIEAFYRRNQNLFLVPEHRSLKLLVIDRATEHADELRDDIAARLRQGEPFARLRTEYPETASEELHATAIQDPAVARAMRALPADDPEAVSALTVTPDFYVWGQAEVFKPHYIPLDDALRNRLRCNIMEHLALRRLARRAEGMEELRAPFRWAF